MWETRLTMKAVKQAVGKHLFQTGYGSLHHYLSGERCGYTAGVYGWNNDIFCIDNVVICSGYRNLHGTPIPGEILDKYNKFAEDIQKAKGFTWDESYITDLRKQFSDELLSLLH